MSSSRDSRPSWSLRVYAWLLGAYPPAFRDEYGDEMLGVFRDSLVTARREQGATGAVSVWIRALADLAVNVPGERGWGIGSVRGIVPPTLWLVAGLFLGVGVIGILSIGLPFLIAGTLLAGWSGRRFGSRGSWAILAGFGLGPAALLTHTLVTTSSGCTPNTGGGYSCTQIPDSYSVLAVFFGSVAFLGLAGPLLAGRPRIERTAGALAGLACLMWPVPITFWSHPVGQACGGTGTVACHSIMAPALWTSGQYGDIALDFLWAIAAGLAIAALAYAHSVRHDRYTFRALWVIAFLLTIYGAPTISLGPVLFLPGSLALIAALAGRSRKTSSRQPPATA